MDTFIVARADHSPTRPTGRLARLASLAGSAWRGHPALTLFALAMGALTVGTAVGVAVDPRTLLGESVWLKPFKFALSFLAFGATLAWLLDRTAAPRPARWAGWVVMASSLVEVALITFQAARGVRSHFNVANPFDGAIFQAMGITVAVLSAATLVLAAIAVRPGAAKSETDRPMVAALRWALVLTLAGMAVALFMVVGQPAVDGLAGAHTVGAADGGARMALTGWSAAGGDLRIPHFVGLHALQVLPLLAGAWTVGASSDAGAGLVTRRLHVAGSAYAGLVALLTWQALRGQPLLAPDALTLAAAAALMAVTAGLYRLAGRQ